MNGEPLSYVLGCISALLIGFSKDRIAGRVDSGDSVDGRGVSARHAAFGSGDSAGDFGRRRVCRSWYHHHAQWRRLWGLFPWVVAGMIPGAVAFQLLDSNRMRPVLGFLVLGMLAFEVWRRWRMRRMMSRARTTLFASIANCKVYRPARTARD